jgi:hypothetical protein
MTDETSDPSGEPQAAADPGPTVAPTGDAAAADSTSPEAPKRALGARARRRAASAAAPPVAVRPHRPSRPPRQLDAAVGHALETGAEHAEAERIEIRQGSIGSAMARSVSVTQGAIGRAQADGVTVVQGALGGARAQRVSLDKGFLGGAIAGDLRVRQGYVQGVVARDVSIEQGGIRTVIANHVTFGRGSGAFLVIARTVDGPGRVLVDWRGAIAAGAAFGLVTALVRRRIRLR